jgi:hypothetical protein
MGTTYIAEQDASQHTATAAEDADCVGAEC